MPASSNQGRAYSAAHFVLELDGNNVVGVIRSVDGGGVKSEIMTYQMGSNFDQWRQIGKPKYEDLKIEFGMSMSNEFYNWIKDFFRGVVVRRNGAILTISARKASIPRSRIAANPSLRMTKAHCQ